MQLSREAFDKLVAENPTALYALVQELARQVATLTAQQAVLTAQVQELTGRLGQHSQNSHRPPASDGPQVAPRSQRQRSGKRPGGQPGHPGQSLAMCAQPDRVVPHYPPVCGQCGADLTAVAATRVARRQVGTDRRWRWR